MKQMVKKDVPVTSATYGKIAQGFMRNGAGEIFYLTAWGKETVPFPVTEDGNVSRRANIEAMQFPGIMVDLIDPKDLGIDEIRWVGSTES